MTQLSLEIQLNAELKSARIANRDNTSEFGRGDVRLNGTEVGRVEDVERLAAKLEPSGFAKTENLGQRKVETSRSRSFDDAASGAANDVRNPRSSR